MHKHLKELVLAAAVLVTVSSPVLAQHRPHHGYHGGHHYRPHHGHSYGPAIGLGILGLGIVGGAMLAQPYPAYTCQDIMVGYDQYGRQVFQRRCY